MPQGELDLLLLLANAGKDALPGVPARGDDAAQLALAHHVVAAAQPGQRPHDGRVRVGFHGEANEVIQRRQCSVELLEVVGQRVLRIDIERGAELADHRPDRHPLAVKVATHVMKIMHKED